MVDELTAFAAAHPGRVRVVTGVVHGEVPAVAQRMMSMCAPSQTTARWREQFGRMLIEAMACGVPVVASGSGEIPPSSATRASSRRSDVAAWTSAIDQLLDDAAAAPRSRGARRGRAHEKFAWPVVAARTSSSSKRCSVKIRRVGAPRRSWSAEHC